MCEQVVLYHRAPREHLHNILREGLRAESRFDDLGVEMLRNVVYCWRSTEDDKMWGRDPDRVYLEVTVDTDRCRVADMDIASVAMMYRQGLKRPPNAGQAARLLARVYEITSVPLADYVPGMFFTPEVLVSGDVAPSSVQVMG